MELSHVSEKGAIMVDVSEKATTDRIAVAHGRVEIKEEVIALLLDGKTPKGDVLNTAKVAGIMAAKRTAEIIPMCHNIPLNKVDVDFEVGKDYIEIKGIAKTSGKTGVEMEALTAVSVSALTIYDMLKAVDKGMTIGEIYLVEKDGGKSGHYQRS